VVIVRCDGGAALGMGHVSRCLALADALRDEHTCAVTFAMRDPDSAGIRAVRASGYDVDLVATAEQDDYGAELVALARARAAAAMVVDVRDALSRASLEALRASGVRVVIVDDGSDRRLASDLAFYPPVPQVEELDWSGYAGRWFAGWDWVLLKPEFAAIGSDSQSAPVDVLVTMGGSDPAGMTEFAVDALNLLSMPLAVQVVIGPAFARAFELIDATARSKHSIQVVHAPRSMASLMTASRIAVASFGVSAYELAACGVPAVHLCLTADHERSSSAFAREEIALTAGVFGALRPRHVAEAAARLMGDAGRRMRMAARARELVDGRGASRVARLVMERARS
jgi:spore coat polysaccharide biosynthesis predicted glycosyltransferase SpsG